MRKYIVALAGLLSAAPFLSAAEPTSSRFYLMPSAEYMFMGNLELKDSAAYPSRKVQFKDAAGLSLEAGFCLTEQHIFKFETGYFKTENEASSAPTVNGFYAPTTAKLEIVPLLLGYKYQQKINERWQFHVGVLQGMTMLRTRTTDHFLGDSVPISGGVIVFPPADYSYNSTDYVFTFGGEVGLDYKLSDRSEFSFGVKCRALGQTDTTKQAVTTSVKLGYKFRF
ncbi:MAG: hypothetical protein QM790_15655 [Nibricoccus sp.]